MAGAWLDDVKSNLKLAGSRSSQMIICPRNKQYEVFQLNDVTESWKLTGNRSSQIINRLEIQTE